ncbi:RluA family pseudouridine synthase [Tenacibaculum adriaticum]|uniref:RluA family pseudouridine synthase n=1 Tax=Tenacibaculum adriaticum TaxID=413713 RepID=A0A5S5DPN6_9FLAO|nr:RluA family pseudouridine synthase [Tenacibaculum adriaticum]TYP97851.1 RluA family pseudouridine synthase [Tenacibaculum adriaticum]
MFSTNTFIHFLDVSIDDELPQKFNYPFQYTPHKISKIAAEEVQNYLENQTDFKGGFDKLGKMFGVLIVKTLEGKLAYITAFSGSINENFLLNGFVPPILDTLNPKVFFKVGEEKLNQITREIEAFEKDELYISLQIKIATAKKQQEQEINAFREVLKTAKKKREVKRKEAKEKLKDDAFLRLSEELQKESVRQSFKLKRLKKDWESTLEKLQEELIDFKKPLTALKTTQKTFSAQLKEQLHENYRFLNAQHQQKNLIEIFKETYFQPPERTGECCAPKLLQFAYQNNLRPITMAEFWWGKSPVSEIKTHKQFYPACKSKCKPVLGFMLQGLEVDKNPVKNRNNIILEIPYEDDYLLVVVKPYRFLSVPGKQTEDSVYTRIKKYVPNATGPMMVHRLDMGTSGLLVIAKTFKVYKHLQQQFADRTVKKRYVAILDGIIKKNSGTINLPLRADYDNLPRQLVCFESGRPALTRYEVIERKNNQTKVYLYPETGRTHQLRVHCAHHLGLNTRIFGDDLYGITKDRLYLHAEQLEFTHPITEKRIEFFCESGF